MNFSSSIWQFGSHEPGEFRPCQTKQPACVLHPAPVHGLLAFVTQFGDPGLVAMRVRPGPRRTADVRARRPSCHSATSVVGFNAGTKVMQSIDARLSILSITELTLELPTDNGTLGKITLRTSDIDALITRLAHFRAAMAPEIPRSGSNPRDISTVHDPLWILHAPLVAEDKLLLVRHPGLGWMMFKLPPSEAAKLGHALLPARPQQIDEERLPSGSFH
jgi:hypothetical protein